MEKIINSEEFIRHLKEAGIKYAVFDIDGTISKTNTIKLYLFVKKCSINNSLLNAVWNGIFTLTLPYYFILDIINRDLFQKTFMKKFSQFYYDDLSAWCSKYFKEKVKNWLIPETVALMNNMKENGFEVSICSLSINLLAQQYFDYFDVKTDASIKITCDESTSRCIVDINNIHNYKLNYVSRFPADKLVVIADSKHDVPIFKYAAKSVIVAKNIKGWATYVKNYFWLKII